MLGKIKWLLVIIAFGFCIAIARKPHLVWDLRCSQTPQYVLGEKIVIETISLVIFLFSISFFIYIAQCVKNNSIKVDFDVFEWYLSDIYIKVDKYRRPLLFQLILLSFSLLDTLMIGGALAIALPLIAPGTFAHITSNICSLKSI